VHLLGCLPTDAHGAPAAPNAFASRQKGGLVVSTNTVGLGSIPQGAPLVVGFNSVFPVRFSVRRCRGLCLRLVECALVVVRSPRPAVQYK
jgi:hypothetical protein